MFILEENVFLDFYVNCLSFKFKTCACLEGLKCAWLKDFDTFPWIREMKISKIFRGSTPFTKLEYKLALDAYLVEKPLSLKIKSLILRDLKYFVIHFYTLAYVLCIEILSEFVFWTFKKADIIVPFQMGNSFGARNESYN